MSDDRKYHYPDSPKPDWASKTLWVNVLIGVIAGLKVVTTDGDITDETGYAIAAIGAVLGIVLRYVTKQPIEFTASKLLGRKK